MFSSVGFVVYQTENTSVEVIIIFIQRIICKSVIFSRVFLCIFAKDAFKYKYLLLQKILQSVSPLYEMSFEENKYCMK